MISTKTRKFLIIGSHTGPTHLQRGMVLAIEPMITQRFHRTEFCSNDWTVVTDDGLLAAHYENTVVIWTESLGYTLI